jgi:DNA-directed RNA polymerase subunit M
MRFCPKCGSLLLPKEGLLVCENCHYSEKLERPEEYTLTKTVEDKKEEGISVVEEERARLPTTRATCPACGNSTAYWWIVQTRRADEPPTRFYRCTKCGKTWREYA